MLGKERIYLKNSRFSFFISNETKQVFILFLSKVFISHTKEVCEVHLSVNEHLPKKVSLTGIVSENGELCMLSAFDITELRFSESELLKAKGKAEANTKKLYNLADHLPCHIA